MATMMSIGMCVCNYYRCLNLFLDFDRIESMWNKKMPKYMEWFGVGLMITLFGYTLSFKIASKLNE
jgi:uncharacterized YccA/Bax inhibitor family protein